MEHDRTELLVGRLVKGATFIAFGGAAGVAGFVAAVSDHPIYARKGGPIEPGFAFLVAAVLIITGLLFVISAVITKLRTK